MSPRFLFAGAAALALAACGGDAGDADVATEDTMAAEQTAVDDPAADAALPTTAQGFVDAAAASDMYEIEAGKLAQENGTDQAIKDFGAMMVTDHTKSSQDLKAAAQTSGATVDPQLTPKQQADLEALRGAGENFDSVYKQQQIAAHEQALAMLRNYATAGDDAALRDFAGKAAPVVEGHLGEARQLP